MTPRRKRAGACTSVKAPHALTYARLFPSGWWCALHTPAAQAGHPEAPPGPGWPIHRALQPDTDATTEQQENSRDH